MDSVTSTVLTLSRKMHFSEECLARGWTATEHPNPVQRFEGGLWLGCPRLGAQKVVGRFDEARFQFHSFSNVARVQPRDYLAVCLAGDDRATG